MKKLKRHAYIAQFTEGKVELCPICNDGGPEFYAGQLNWSQLPRDAPRDLIEDIEDTLGVKIPRQSTKTSKLKSE